MGALICRLLIAHPRGGHPEIRLAELVHKSTQSRIERHTIEKFMTTTSTFAPATEARRIAGDMHVHPES